MKNIVKGKISQSYAAELARQVGELETENERQRDKIAQLERDWDLRADAIRRTQKLHRAEVKELRAEIKRLKGFWTVWQKHKGTSPTLRALKHPNEGTFKRLNKAG